MTDMTPDELRKACHLDDDDGVTVTRCWGVMRAAADALDAAVAAQQTLLAALNESTCENDTLRERLEAAEQQIREMTPGYLAALAEEENGS